jgi:hypothetical protein
MGCFAEDDDLLYQRNMIKVLTEATELVRQYFARQSM